MMTLYCEEQRRIVSRQVAASDPFPANVIWIDLFNPERAEELAAENFLGIGLPTREEMSEIEISNRLYQEDDAQYMTATVVTKMDSDQPESHAITFILCNKALTTIRYADPIPFKTYIKQIDRIPPEEHEGATILLGLLDSVVNRLADILEKVGRDIDSITQSIFRRQDLAKHEEPVKLEKVLSRIGRSGDLVSKVHESLVTLGRMAVYASHSKRMCLPANDALLIEIRRDITGLNDHTSFLSNKLGFLLDATLGMVSIQQNNVFRILSVASLIFMPPTLIAGVYGMNFKLIPELNWHWGYPLSILLMVFSAVLPLAYLKQKKYL